MRIGEFISRMETTKDTVRHYEELNLLQPERIGSRKEYGDREMEDFQVVRELKAMGFCLKDIAGLFEHKRNLGCGNALLLKAVLEKMTVQIQQLKREEEGLRLRRLSLEEEQKQLKLAMAMHKKTSP